MAHGQESIQTLLGGLMKDRRMLTSMRRVMVMTVWDQVVGELVAQKSWPEKVADGVLTVGVTSHTWADQLHLLKPQILSRYRQLLGRNILKDLVFRVGRRKASQGEAVHHHQALRPTPAERPAVQPVPREVFAEMRNPEVKELLGPAFARLRAERQWKTEHGWTKCSACHRIYHGDACPQCAQPLQAG